MSTSPARTGPAELGAFGSEEADVALRADIRRLGQRLGESLVRQVGQELLDGVEAVRRLTRADPAAAAALLREVDPIAAGHLVRAFSAFFHLADTQSDRPTTEPGAATPRRPPDPGVRLASGVAAP